MSLDFLDKALAPLLKPVKKVTETDRLRRRVDNKYYARCKRLMKKHNITMTRDMSYWDFSAPVGTCGLNDNVECWTSAYEWLCARLVEVGLETINHDKENP